ncbi:MAG TPA: glycine oxidase ThiO [Candidatus Micrarchaeia archaeon]|nr:glycine oxidase ThiO [Candidatus Micrarchaeia archaeon]
MPVSSDVVVVGGGAIGLAIAWRAAAAGLGVTVVDPGLGTGASWAAAGMLAPISEAAYGEEPLLLLSLEAARRYPSFVAELEAVTGTTVGYRTCGTLTVAADSGDRAQLAERHRHQVGLGLHVEWLGGRACRGLEPLLAPAVQGGVLAEGDHQVETRLMVRALGQAAEGSGAAIVRDTVDLVRLERGRVVGVTTAGGVAIGAPQVVLCAGCWSGGVAGLPPEALPPVRPVKGQILRLRGPADAPLLSRSLGALVAGRFVYAVPRGDGRLVVGATSEEQGFDTTVRAGAVMDLLEDLAAVLPAARELELVEARAALRPGSPDNAPILGPTSVPGLLVATGHHRHGILLTPVTADAITTILTTGSVPEMMAPFLPARFVAAAP